MELKTVKLYLLHLCKGKQNFNIGDNIKDYLDDVDDFKEKKLLNWGIDFEQEISTAAVMCKQKIQLGSENLINECFVICTGTGKIRGILPINENHPKQI